MIMKNPEENRGLFFAKNYRSYRLSLAIGSILLYFIIFILLHYLFLFTGLPIFAVIPVIVIAWLYGSIPGVIASMLFIPVNMLMLTLVGISWVDNMLKTGGGISGTVGFIVIAVIVGRLSDLGQRLSKELHEKQIIEEELKLHRESLEQLVNNKTRELQKAFSKIEEDKLFLEHVFRASPDAITVADDVGNIIMANESLYSVYGYHPEEVIGQHVSVFTPDDEQAVQSSMAMIEKLHEAGIIRDFVSKRKRKDGSIIDIEASHVLLKNPDGSIAGSVSSTRDITDRMRFEEMLRQSHDYLETIFRASPDAITVADADGYIVMANESVLVVYGYEPDEIVGQHGSLFAPDEETGLQQSMELLEELFKKGIVRNAVIERRHKDGRTLQVEASQVLLKNPDGSFAGSVSSTRDITERKKFEDQLRQSQKMEAIGTLAGGIAHDFNNILAAIMGYTELSKDLAKGNSVLERNLSQVLKSVDRAKALVRQILAFSRKTASEVKALHLHMVIAEALKLLRASLPSTISIRSDIDDTEDVVVADATEIYQIVMNLCTNAAYAMNPTGGIIEVTLKPVDLDWNDVGYYTGIGPGPYVQLSVKDTGMGIPADIIGRIFEPFFTTKEIGKGTGMGLAMVHGIVKSCKGDIKVYSEPGKGAIFHVVLPRSQSETVEMAAVEREAPQGTESVLLVDDEAILLDVGEKILRSIGYRVTTTGSAVEALEMFKKNPASFDIVITDQTMPSLTGYELAQQLIAIRADIPVILCTGYSDLVTAESAIGGGIKAFVIKPLNRIAIADTIRQVLGKSAA
jgi:two-component system, cell cycle sensor histidine kinase and response regulator CckA